AIMGVQSGTARVKGGLRLSQAIASRPLTRTAPNLRSAAIGAMRRTARALDTYPSTVAGHGWQHPDCRTDRLARPQASRAVQELAGGVEVAEMTSGLLKHV